MVARLASRIGKLEKSIRPGEPGCGRCRGHRILGLGEYQEKVIDGRTRYACSSCGRLGIKVIVGVDIQEVL